MRKKRLTGILLAFVMVLSLFPGVALAEEGGRDADDVWAVAVENSTGDGELSAGAGAGEIVFPEAYFPEDGFDGTVHDSPYARVLVLEQDIKVAIVSLETANCPTDLLDPLKQIVSDETGVPAENVWIHATHNFGFMHRPSDEDKAEMFNVALTNAVTEAAEQAAESFQPAVMGVGTGESYVNANRNIRTPEGIEGIYYGLGSTDPSNKTMTILRFESLDGDPIGFFMSYGIKPTALFTTGQTVGNRQLTGEVPGVACKMLEEEFGVPAMFCMPAAGDQIPREMSQYYEFVDGEAVFVDIGFDEGIKIVERLGEEMGNDAIEIARGITCDSGAKAISIATTSFTWESSSTREPDDIEVLVDVITLGDVAFVGFKQEIDCVTELELWEASPFEHTLLVSFLNGDGKYMPHDAAYDIGTYETTRTSFVRGAAEEFVATAAELLNSLYVLPFDDVEESDWFYEAVQFAYTRGLMTGTGDTTFNPESAVTRGMVVTTLWRMEGEPEGEYDGFTDLEQDWYVEAVAWAADNDIVQGHSPTEFAPEDDITREQLTAMFYNYADFKGQDVSERVDISGYVDADQVSDWAEDGMNWAIAVGLVRGVSDDELRLEPAATSDRAQLATILMRFLDGD